VTTNDPFPSRAPAAGAIVGTSIWHGAQGRTLRYATVVGLLLLQSALLLHAAIDKADTFDEPIYLTAGALQVVHGDLRTNCESAALPKWGFGAVLRLVDETIRPDQLPRDTAGARDRILYERPYRTMRRNLLAPRSATILVVLAGSVLLWLVGRRFGEPAALLGLALWCGSPMVLGSGSLATLDAWCAVALIGVAWAVVRVFEHPTIGRVAVVGVTAGLALACKVTALMLVPIGVLMTIAAGRPSARVAWGRVAVMVAACGFTLWGCYGFDVGPVHLAHPCGMPWPLAATETTWSHVPAAPWVEGALAQIAHGRAGHWGYLHGRMSMSGRWWYFLASLGLKATIGSLGLALVRLWTMWRSKVAAGERWIDAALLAPVVVLFVAMSASRVQNGFRYLLPAVPFVCWWLGRLLNDRAGVRGTWERGLVVVGVAASLLEAVAQHPHHLMHFNPFAGGPAGGARWVVGEDWGQDQRRLARWQRDHGVWPLHFTPFTGRPERWGIHAVPLPCTPTPGVHAVHVVDLMRPRGGHPSCAAWLADREPIERLGGSVWVYRVSACSLAPPGTPCDVDRRE
jgi:Dolichyl-phosphate-mannose-protein mannosyltransferase